MHQDYVIKELTEKEFMPLFERHSKTVFEDFHNYTVRDVLSEAETQRMETLKLRMGNLYSLHLGVFDREDKFVGWCWGTQENRSAFYMVNSGVLNEHRRKGLYGALVNECVQIVAKQGFQLIYSRHCATNNAVIIPKLKAGFVISKMEMDDRFGVLIHLHYYTSAIRRKIMDYRSGLLAPDEEIKRIFKL